ncbi:aminoglycoside phosphotransferase family protein [Segeticoccus rhizosphaerae]|jgi:aminoglycoside phosphotransferase (APT) family kinase protein|uniref:aminoglycoside phosphotransferase family protein n=1 Tax=Segeticoccus rhizosphaerae TaxID=1104777 RepID=UPI0013904B4E|nr:MULTISPECIES: aminoglycoside phosphotransferase family protein [Intrasporangiaceae]
MITDTVAEDVVLGSLQTALSEEVKHGDLERLVVIRTSSRRRSVLYFVGLASDPTSCRWVVKRPNVTIRQDDLASPLHATAQYEGLRRLHDGLARAGGAVRAPRPLAYLAEIEAFAMEYVPGHAITELMGPRALLDDDTLLRAVGAAAGALRAVHSIQAPQSSHLDLPDLERRALARGARLLESAGLPGHGQWFARTHELTPISAGSRVLLHGDFAPENVVLSSATVYCLDPDLTQEDWAELDVVRFLLMLFDAPLFVAGGGLRQAQWLRRRATATFLDAYYGGAPWSGALRPLMVLSLITRWATRDAGITERAPRLAVGRRLLVRRHFMSLLDEVASPSWPAAHR